MGKIVKLKCGLRLALEEIPYVQSVTTGIWVKAGCVDEKEKESGISHFIEHMMFKGTSKRSARQLATDTDALGAQTNAFTAKENTCYYAKSLSSNMDEVCDILLEMMTDSQFDPVEMEREKKVVMEEMKMTQDNPEDAVQDLFYEQIFKGEPLERPILGTPESLAAITHDDIVNYIKREYALDNIVVSVAGNFDEKQVCEQFEERLSAFSAVKPERNIVVSDYRPSFKSVIKDIEQSHLVMGCRSIKYGDDDSYALMLLNNVMGGSMSSRLFQSVREEKGLAYTVYSYNQPHDQQGFYAISAGVAHDKIEDTVDAIKAELEKLAEEGITDKELEISKQQIKSSYIFGLENTSSRMVANGKRALLRNSLLSQEEVIRKIDAVTMDDIRRVSNIITDINSYSGALIGRRDLDLEKLIRG
ncbi:MAG: pitrilysin family protein [Anaerovoracaceae bacterium]|nr:pitrilysin family protein [Bacillota bacterium]MDY2669979.1 pitrilysin family protein [Anaerovoracaceae bacterium]